MAFQTQRKELTKLQVRLVNSKDISPYTRTVKWVPVLTPGLQSQPAQL